MIADGRLPSIRLGGKVRIAIGQLDAFLDDLERQLTRTPGATPNGTPIAHDGDRDRRAE